MKKIVLGILAHVDAGKTTLSEGMLYLSGKTARLGRVDNKDAYLDTHELERERGITIFAKQAVFELGETEITLLDTPGHVDFSAEMERTLQVIDYAILVISGADGVQGHTATLWRLLRMYRVPVFLFVNKMDQPGTDRIQLLAELKSQLSEEIVDFGGRDDEFFEELAMCDETLMEAYFDTGKIETALLRQAICQRKVFPCFFGSALKLEGVDMLLESIADLTETALHPASFGAKVFKVSRDDQGQRLTHLKITGGRLQVRDAVSNGDWTEKVNQIRIYSGGKYHTAEFAEAGSVCAVTGLSLAMPGDGLGFEGSSLRPVLEPVLSYKITLPEGEDQRLFLLKLRELEEEVPELQIVWNEKLQEIQAQVMGDVQVEILQSLILNRFDVEVFLMQARFCIKKPSPMQWRASGTLSL